MISGGMSPPQSMAGQNRGWVIMPAAENKLLFPGLAGFYESWRDIAYTVLRIVVGANLLVHGWMKVSVYGVAGVSGLMAKSGLEPATAFAVAAMFLETIGAICIIIGLFTRFFAAALAIEMLIGLLAVHLKAGFSVSHGGYEYILLLGIALFAIAIRGGGPYSVDRMIGKEL
jgi:putative oxidoreductase